MIVSDDLTFPNVDITTPQVIYWRFAFIYRPPNVRVVNIATGKDEIDRDATGIASDGKSWTVSFADGDVWTVVQSTECACRGSRIEQR